MLQILHTNAIIYVHVYEYDSYPHFFFIFPSSIINIITLSLSFFHTHTHTRLSSSWLGFRSLFLIIYWTDIDVCACISYLVAACTFDSEFHQTHILHSRTTIVATISGKMLAAANSYHSLHLYGGMIKLMMMLMMICLSSLYKEIEEKSRSIQTREMNPM